jgi:hypothetical protein
MDEVTRARNLVADEGSSEGREKGRCRERRARREGEVSGREVIKGKMLDAEAFPDEPSIAWDGSSWLCAGRLGVNNEDGDVNNKS